MTKGPANSNPYHLKPTDFRRHQTWDPSWWRGDGTGLQPFCDMRDNTWGVAPGWYKAAPLALTEACHQTSFLYDDDMS